MAILSSTKINKDYTLELVNKDHIMKTYMMATPEGVHSCMTAYPGTKFYSFVKDLSLLRIRKGEHLKARALIWDTKTPDKQSVKFLDRIYSVAKLDYDDGGDFLCNHSWTATQYCPTCKPVAERDFVYDYFLKNWNKFADVRNSNKTLLAKVSPGYKRTKLLKGSYIQDGEVYFDTFMPIDYYCGNRYIDAYSIDNPTIIAMTNKDIGYQQAKELVKSLWS